MALKSKKTGKISNSILRQLVQYVRYGDHYGWPCKIYTSRVLWPDAARVDTQVKGNTRHVTFYGSKGYASVLIRSDTPRAEIKRIARKYLEKVGHSKTSKE